MSPELTRMIDGVIRQTMWWLIGTAGGIMALIIGGLMLHRYRHHVRYYRLRRRLRRQWRRGEHPLGDTAKFPIRTLSWPQAHRTINPRSDYTRANWNRQLADLAERGQIDEEGR
jgi:hypothetical protein